MLRVARPMKSLLGTAMAVLFVVSAGVRSMDSIFGLHGQNQGQNARKNVANCKNLRHGYI
jgi:hypothetical protein